MLPDQPADAGGEQEQQIGDEQLEGEAVRGVEVGVEPFAAGTDLAEESQHPDAPGELGELEESHEPDQHGQRRAERPEAPVEGRSRGWCGEPALRLVGGALLHGAGLVAGHTYGEERSGLPPSFLTHSGV